MEVDTVPPTDEECFALIKKVLEVETSVTTPDGQVHTLSKSGRACLRAFNKLLSDVFGEFIQHLIQVVTLPTPREIAAASARSIQEHAKANASTEMAFACALHMSVHGREAEWDRHVAAFENDAYPEILKIFEDLRAFPELLSALWTVIDELRRILANLAKSDDVYLQISKSSTRRIGMLCTTGMPPRFRVDLYKLMCNVAIEAYKLQTEEPKQAVDVEETKKKFATIMERIAGRDGLQD